MIDNQRIRVGALTMVLLLFTIMLVAINASQNYASAQYDTSIPKNTLLIPTLEPSDSEKELFSSDGVSNNGDTGNTHFYKDPLSSEEEDELKDELLSSKVDNENIDDSDSQQDTSPTEEDELEGEDVLTNPLRKQIRNTINGALSAFG